MSGIKRVTDFATQEIRLMVEGNWLPAFDAEIRRGGFHILELHRGDYEDFSFLIPYADLIQALWINSPSRSSKGLQELKELRSLTLSYEIGKDIDFNVFPKLISVNFDAWFQWYGKAVFCNQTIEKLRIEGYEGHDCIEFGKLTELRELVLAKGRLKTLNGLRSCRKLREIKLSHLRQLDDISEISVIPTLCNIELNEVLPRLVNIETVYSKINLVSLVLMGVAASVENVHWLKNFSELEILRLQIPVDDINWDTLFGSKKLKKLVVMSAKPLSTSEDELRSTAIKHKLQISSITIFGTKKTPSWLIEFQMTQNP